MAEGRRPSLYTIPAHRAFSDALVAGLMRRHGREPLDLARGLVLVPNNRAKVAVTEAFVRAAGGGLVLPRLVAIGADDPGEAIGAALDPGDDAVPVPPAITPLARRMILARLVQEERSDLGAAEAVRLSGDLARTLDQLIIEEVPPSRLAELDLGPELSAHWQRALAAFRVVLDRWPGELAKLGRIDLAERRARLLDLLGARWRSVPPPGFVCAAGVNDSAPSVAQLLRRIADLPRGMVVLANVDTAMPDEEWDAIGPHGDNDGRRAIEVHPQYHLKLLLERMGVGRAEVSIWREGSEYDAASSRSRTIANALAPADFTGKWTELPLAERRLTGVRAAEFATPSGEAQAIALALRGALETPGRTAALVTPDRALARRVAAHCRRWKIDIFDTAGQPLSVLPPGTLLSAIAEAAAQDFAPLALLTLLKHPLVRAGAERIEWLEGVRRLDRALRGPRPAPGLAGIDAQISDDQWWSSARRLLEPIAAALGHDGQSLAQRVAGLRDAANALAGDEAWRGPAGRAAADLLAALETEADTGPRSVSRDDFVPLIRLLMDEVAVRPAQGGHPRVAIYGLIEARLQTADLMILGGLNEGVWPGIPAPDPWLAPRIRAMLGLPGLERRIGVAAHDFGQGLGAPEVLLTRARRDSRSPTLASRFWLRLEAMAGKDFARAHDLEHWAEALDRPTAYRPVIRPAPSPAKAMRPRQISVTQVDRLKADPFAFYAQRILRLSSLDPVDADPTAAWRGTAVHDVLEKWAREDDCAIEKLRPRALAMLDSPAAHPLLRALWQPRLIAAIDWIANRLNQQRAEGRMVLRVEEKGATEIAGVTLSGKFDRIDRAADGSLVIVDYKTGKAPSPAVVKAGFSMQLGLLGAIAEADGFAGITGTAGGFEYWSLAKYRDEFGQVTSPADPAGKNNRIVTGEFVAQARAAFAEAAARWLTGDEPFIAKLHPEYAPYADYDQLMRRDEWYGRDR